MCYGKYRYKLIKIIDKIIDKMMRRLMILGRFGVISLLLEYIPKYGCNFIKF